MRVLVVGCGNWGDKLLERFCKLLGPADVIPYDTDKKRLLAVAKRYDLIVYNTGFPEVFQSNSYDAAVIATPPKTHYEIAKMCLEAGKHILIEKPMTLNVNEAKELISLAQAKKLTLMTDDTFLYGAPFTYHRMSSEVFEAHWTGPRLPDPATPEEGILWTLGPHPVSIMLKVMARYPLEVEADVKPRQARLIYQFTGGDEATIVLDWDTPVRERSVFSRVGCRTSVLDLSTPRNPEPLMEMCKTFVIRARSTHWIDTHALKVVEALQMAEEACKSG